MEASAVGFGPNIFPTIEFCLVLPRPRRQNYPPRLSSSCFIPLGRFPLSFCWYEGHEASISFQVLRLLRQESIVLQSRHLSQQSVLVRISFRDKQDGCRFFFSSSGRDVYTVVWAAFCRYYVGAPLNSSASYENVSALLWLLSSPPGTD